MLAVRVMICYKGDGRAIVMCVAVSVMICYRGEREGNGDVCCS